MIIYFEKDKDGWWVANAVVPKDDRRLSKGASELLDMLFPTKVLNDGYDTVVMAFGSMENDYSMSPHYKGKGFSAIYKQLNIPGGGASYVCPSFKGNHINHYLSFNESFKKVINNNFPEIIYFK